MQVRMWGIAVTTAMLAVAPRAFAQQSVDTVSVTGVVRDATGAAIVAADVELRSLARNEASARRTDVAGRFAFLSVPPGEYTLRVSAAGFTASVSSLRLLVGQALEVPLSLSVADVTASVEVTAGAPVIETRRTQLAHTVLPEGIDTLPLNGRNPAGRRAAGGRTATFARLVGCQEPAGHARRSPLAAPVRRQPVRTARA